MQRATSPLGARRCAWQWLEKYQHALVAQHSADSITESKWRAKGGDSGSISETYLESVRYMMPDQDNQDAI